MRACVCIYLYVYVYVSIARHEVGDLYQSILLKLIKRRKGKKSTSLVGKRNRNFELSLESRGGGVHREPLELRVVSVLSCYDVGKSLKKISI